MPRKRSAYSRQEFVPHYAMAKLDRGGKAFGIGPAVTLDHNAIQSKEDPAVGAARIHPLSQLPKGGLREQIADACAERPAHSAFEIFSDLTSGTFGGFQRNIPGKALRDDAVTLAAADIVTLHEALVFDIGEIFLTQHAPRLAHLFKPFRLLHAD